MLVCGAVLLVSLEDFKCGSSNDINVIKNVISCEFILTILILLIVSRY